MRISKNYLSAVGGLMMLVVSLVLSAPRATNACDSKLSRTARPVAFVPESTSQLPMSGAFVAGRMLAKTSIWQATEADTADDLSIDASFGDENISLERKKHRRRGCSCNLVVISIIGVLVGKPVGAQGPPMIDLRATITGPDAVRGSLLYGLAWLAGDPNPIRAVRALGYDIDVSKEHDRPCTDGPPSPECVERARRLATLLDATLPLGDPEEWALFRQGASALGIATDCSAASTTGGSAVSRAGSADRPEDLLIDASIGDRQIVLERKSGRPKVEFMDIRLKEVIVTNVQPGPGHGDGASLNVRITGPDMVPGSLLYAVAWLAGQPDPLGSVRALGYDIAVSDQRIHNCSNQRAGFTCEDEAHRLATLLDATLALGGPEERAQFRRDALVIGVAPDCSLRVP
jgi:hypothetical protein